MGRIRKNVSIDEEVLKKGQAKADKMFAGNFSMYLMFLINKDCENMIIEEKKNNNIKEDEEVETISIDKDTINELDNILGI